MKVLRDSEREIVGLYLWDHIKWAQKEIESLKNELQTIVETLMGKHKLMVSFDDDFAKDYASALSQTFEELQICDSTLQDLMTDSHDEVNLKYVYTYEI